MMETKLDFTNSARLIKSRITLRQVLNYYGIQFSGKHIVCPLPNHNENTPSFKVYEEDSTDGNFYCYGCQKSGDIISFVSSKENISLGQAINRLANMFNVQLITKENIPDKLVTSLELILSKKKKEPPKEITELVKWQILAEKVRKEFSSLGSEIVPYLEKKKIPHLWTKSKWDQLIVPLCDIKGKIWSFQQIGPNGEKMFLADGRKKGMMLCLPGNGYRAYLTEGFATGASVYLSTGITTFVCFSASNLDNVAEQVFNEHYWKTIIVAGDNDESGHQHHQFAVYPPEYKTDWSDYYILHGPEKTNILLNDLTKVYN